MAVVRAFTLFLATTVVLTLALVATLAVSLFRSIMDALATVPS